MQESLVTSNKQLHQVDIACHYQSADQTGGDWYGYFQDPATGLCFVICGDVVGHGVPAALVTGVATGAVTSVMDSFFAKSIKGMNYSVEEAILEIFARANGAIFATKSSEMRVMTLAAVVLDIHTGQVWQANAGHPFPFLLTESKTKAMRMNSVMQLGHDEVMKELPIETYFAEPGDTFVLFSDGLIENQGPQGKQLPLKFLRRGLLHDPNRSSAQTLGIILAEGKKYWQGQRPDDDCSVVVFRWMGAVPNRAGLLKKA